MKIDTNDLITVKTASLKMGLSKERIRQLITKENKILAVKIDGVIFVRRKDIADLKRN